MTLAHAADSPLASHAAAKVIPVVQALVNPATAIDVGCGTGAFTRGLLAAGVDAYGADVAGVRPHLLFEEDRFYEVDLNADFRLPVRFDLVLSLEVAEHLPSTSAKGFVEILAALGDFVVFSAASPHQSGPGHVNLQWPAYWADLFAECGYACADALRPRLWNDDAIAWYYRQNILLFGQPQKLAELGLVQCEPLALVHPRHLDAATSPSGRAAILVLMTVARLRFRNATAVLRGAN